MTTDNKEIKAPLKGAEARQQSQIDLLLSAISDNHVDNWSSSCIKKQPFTVDGKNIKKYFGINSLILSIVGDDLGVESAGWLTGNKCKGFNLRFNSLKSAPVVYNLPSSVKIFDDKRGEVAQLVRDNVSYGKKRKDTIIKNVNEKGFIDINILMYIYKKKNHLAPRDKVVHSQAIGDLGRASGRGHLCPSQVFNLSQIEGATIANTYLPDDISLELTSAETNEDRVDIIERYLETELDDKATYAANNYAKSMKSLISIAETVSSIDIGVVLGNDELFSRKEVTTIIDSIVKALDVDIRLTSSPFYSPSTDHIGMPDISSAKTPTGFLFTFLHELSHWTGNENRFKDFGRKTAISLSGKGGTSSDYALEELAVTISASNMIANSTGYYVLAGMNEKTPETNIEIPNDPMAYLKSWSSEDPSKRNAELSMAVTRGDFIAMGLDSIVNPIISKVIEESRSVESDIDSTDIYASKDLGM